MRIALIIYERHLKYAIPFFQAFLLFRHSFVKAVDPVDAADIDQTEKTDDQGQSIQ